MTPILRFAGSAVAAVVTLVAVFWGLSKAVAPATDATLLIIGELDLFEAPEQHADGEETWCRREPNRTLQLAASFRELCDEDRADCGPECTRVSTGRWSADCAEHETVQVCVPHNPLLGANGGSG